MEFSQVAPGSECRAVTNASVGISELTQEAYLHRVSANDMRKSTNVVIHAVAWPPRDAEPGGELLGGANGTLWPTVVRDARCGRPACGTAGATREAKAARTPDGHPPLTDRDRIGLTPLREATIGCLEERSLGYVR